MVEREETELRPGNQNYSWTLFLIPEETDKLLNPYKSALQGSGFCSPVFLSYLSACQAAELLSVRSPALAHSPCALGSLIES